MAGKRRGLGKGLDALLGDKPKQSLSEDAHRQSMRQIPVEWIRPGKYQPRKYIAKEPLQELAASIKAQGLMQPIVLRTVGDNRYEIIAGERRWRATQLAGLDKVPAIIKEVDDESAVAMSLIENIQREDLNPMEESMALQRLVDDFSLTHQQVAEAVGKSRTAVTNYLRLLSLSDPVATMLETGEIEMGHARALLGLTAEQQLELAKQVSSQNLSVRKTEALVKKVSSGGAQKPRSIAPGIAPGNDAKDADVHHLEETLSLKIGQPVSIQQSRKGAGKLIINYSSLDELDGILVHFGDFH